jgi:hypothetical protein
MDVLVLKGWAVMGLAAFLRVFLTRSSIRLLCSAIRDAQKLSPS